MALLFHRLDSRLLTKLNHHLFFCLAKLTFVLDDMPHNIFRQREWSRKQGWEAKQHSVPGICVNYCLMPLCPLTQQSLVSSKTTDLKVFGFSKTNTKALEVGWLICDFWTSFVFLQSFKAKDVAHNGPATSCHFQSVCITYKYLPFTLF